MEQLDSVVQELTNGGWTCDKVNWATSYAYASSPTFSDEICLKVDKDGNVIHFDGEAFHRLLETTTDPYTKALGAVYMLGYLKGLTT